MKTWGHKMKPLTRFEVDEKLPCSDPPDCSGPATWRATWVYQADAAARPWGQSKLLCRHHAGEHTGRLAEAESMGGGS